MNGKVGANGPQRAKGDTGATGEQGKKGDKGDPGDRGDKGDKGDQGKPGISNLETDGPYPGRPDPENNLSGDQGDQSTKLWSHDGTLQTSWVMCAPGKTALGGGFGQDDAQTDQLVIVTSSPARSRTARPTSMTRTCMSPFRATRLVRSFRTAGSSRATTTARAI